MRGAVSMPAARRVAISGRSIAYRRAGAGSPLILLHGFGIDSRIWRPQFEEFGRDFDVIAWDAPGAGLSDEAPATFTIADWADDLAAFLGTCDVDRANVFGLSWGGLLAQELCRRHGSLVRTLVLADTYAGWRGSLSEGVAAQRLAQAVENSGLEPKAFAAAYVPSMFGPARPPGASMELASIMAGFHPEGFRLMAAALADEDTRDLLPTIRAPTLLIWGEGDARSPLTVARAFHAAIPGSELAVIPGAGHVSNLEDPPAFNAHVRAFLAAHADDAPPTGTRR